MGAGHRVDKRAGRHLCASGGGQEPAEFGGLRNLFGGDIQCYLWRHDGACCYFDSGHSFSRKERIEQVGQGLTGINAWRPLKIGIGCRLFGS